MVQQTAIKQKSMIVWWFIQYSQIVFGQTTILNCVRSYFDSRTNYVTIDHLFDQQQWFGQLFVLIKWIHMLDVDVWANASVQWNKCEFI